MRRPAPPCLAALSSTLQNTCFSRSGSPLMGGKVVGVLRFVTSLRQVNVQVRMTVLAVVLVALLCLLLVLSSNLIFINNVVEPVAVVSDAAQRISQGSYGFTLENK